MPDFIKETLGDPGPISEGHGRFENLIQTKRKEIRL
jgi:hypothetical protein